MKISKINENLENSWKSRDHWIPYSTISIDIGIFIDFEIFHNLEQ